MGLKREIENPCKKCGAMNWDIGEVRDSGGVYRYPYYCKSCGNRTTFFATKKIGLLKKRTFLKDYATEHCAVCGALGAQIHHWAPFHIWGSDYSDWPVSYLCQVHHAEWHNRIKNHRK